MLKKWLAKQAKSQVGAMAVNRLRKSFVLPLKPCNTVNVPQKYAIPVMQKSPISTNTKIMKSLSM
jgi:hypothetical protein